MYKIYKYTNLINNKIYIGQTKQTLEERAQKDGKNYKGSKYFYNAIQKYGWENFKSEILKDNLTLEQANCFEEYYINLFNSTNPDVGYNIRLGGNNTPLNEESKKIISVKAKERYKDPTKNPNYGKHWSDDFKKRMKERFSGENGYWYGTHKTDEEKQYLSNLFKGTQKTTRKTPYTEEELKQKQIIMKETSKMWSKKVRCLEDDIVFDTITDCAKYLGRSVQSVSDVLHGRSKTCNGKHIEFID